MRMRNKWVSGAACFSRAPISMPTFVFSPFASAHLGLLAECVSFRWQFMYYSCDKITVFFLCCRLRHNIIPSVCLPPNIHKIQTFIFPPPQMASNNLNSSTLIITLAFPASQIRFSLRTPFFGQSIHDSLCICSQTHTNHIGRYRCINRRWNWNPYMRVYAVRSTQTTMLRLHSISH